MEHELSVVGKRLPRPDAIEKATGAARYTVDIRLPGMLIGKVLRSPYPHANILKIDKSKAEKLPGVEAIITVEDVPRELFNGTFSIYKMSPERAKGEVMDRYVLSDKARYVGDGIAAVAAINKDIAEEALGLIQVEYEKLAAVFNEIEAMRPEAPRVHDFANRNIAKHLSYPFTKGDVEKGFQEAHCVVEATFSTSKQKHCQLELDAAVASFDPKGRLTIWTPCNHVHLFRRRIADIFNIREGMVRVITPYIGGAFGGRSNFNAEPICIALARKAGKPVKLQYTSEEDFIVHMSREPFNQTGKMGVKKDGTITALQTKLISNGGAYFETSGATTSVNMLQFMGLYRCPNMAGEGEVVYTNTPVSGGMRGYGSPSAHFVLEQLVDMAAEKIGMDPVEFRLRNHKRTGEPSWWPMCPIMSCALDECLRVGAERINWKEKKAIKKEGLKRRGIGVAVMMHPSSVYALFMEHSSAFIKLDEDGSASVIISTTEQGQGSLSVLAQIAAEELGIRAEDVRVVTGDTDITMFDMGTYGSRTTHVLGAAVLRAAREAKGQLLERAGKVLKVSPSELEVKDGRIYVRIAPEIGISVAEVAKNAIYNYKGECLNISGKSSFENTSVSPAFQAAFTEVEVDTETGQVKVLKIVIAHDIGKAINPMNVEGQLEGGAVQGLGYALMEDFVIDKITGATITDSHETYKIPSVLDVPEIEVILVEKGDPAGPFGAKGVGEPGLVTIAPSVANAIYDAIGVRIADLPITPEKILKALKTN